MEQGKSDKDELVFITSSAENEKYFAGIVVAAFLVVVAVAPVYFGEELSWFGYISFIVLSIGAFRRKLTLFRVCLVSLFLTLPTQTRSAAMILSLPEVETSRISKSKGRATLEKRRMIIPTRSIFVCELADVESVGVEKIETLGSKVNKMCRVVLRTATGMNFALSSHFYRNVEKAINEQAQTIADFIDKPISDEALWDADDDIQNNPRPHHD